MKCDTVFKCFQCDCQNLTVQHKTHRHLIFQSYISHSRSLYADQSKAETIEKLILQYIENLSKSGAFSSDPSEVKQPASALLWAYYYAAQHFDYKKDTDRALHYIDAAIEHTPTLIELFIVKGRIYKVCGCNFLFFLY